jgi:MSHA biogenesis protein MshP
MMNRYPAINRSGGFSMIAAIFLLVVLGALGVYMVSISQVQHLTTAHSLQGSRAYQAARAGIEWGIYRATNNGNCSAFPNTINFSSGGLADYQVTISCSLTSHQEISHPFNVFELSAAANSGSTFGTLGYAARTITASVTDAPP